MLHKTGDYVATTSGGAAIGKASSGVIYAMPFEDRYIWGIIARIVRNLYDRVCG
jgi:hypothetical protein